MKTPLRLALFSVGLLAATSLFAADPAPSAAAANPPAHPRLPARLKHRAAVRRHLAKKLGLGADQVAQLKAKHAATVASLKAIRADATLTPEQKRAKARATLQAARTDMRTVLTPDQQAKLDALRAAHGRAKP